MISINADGIKDIFNAGRKVEPTAVGIQWALMTALCLLTIFIFNLLRPSNKIIYQPKVKYHAGDKAPPRISSSLCGWVVPLLLTQDPELIQKIGVDAVVFIHFVRLLRWLFLIVTIASCGILVPIDYAYNIKYQPADLDVLSAMSIRDVKGPMLYAHVVLTYFITFVVILLVHHYWKGVLQLRSQWFHSPEYLHSFYARTLCITQVHPRYQSDQGINEILSSVKMSYPATAVHIGRHVGQLPKLIKDHNDTVENLERVLVRYLRKGKLGRKRPTIRVGKCCYCLGGQRKDAINFYTNKLKKTKANINDYRAEIDARKPTNYGFVSLAAVPYAHTVAKELANKHPQGVNIELAPNPHDIMWDNISLLRGTIVWKKILGFLALAAVCVLSLIPLFFAATLANLDVITQTGYLPFLKKWSESSPWTYTIASATLPPLAALIAIYLLPKFMRWLTNYMGALTRSHLDRAVIARYFAFLVISQLFIFTLIGVAYNLLLELIKILQKPGASPSEVFAVLDQLPRNISRSYVNQAGFWLKWFPLRGLLMLIDLLQIRSLIWIPIKTYFFGRTPRNIREWTKPPKFEYAIYYSNLLFCAAVVLLFAPLAPLVALAGAMVFWACTWIYKYQLIYRFVTKVETGGRLWNVVINRLLCCVVFMQLLMILTIGLAYNFALKQTLLVVPAVLIVAIYKFYISRAFLPHFRYFIPREEDLLTIAQYSANADATLSKLERRFGHPTLHTGLFTPMLHKRMLPLLQDVYKGRADEIEETLPFITHQPDQGGRRMGTVGSAPDATPTSAVPGSPGDLNAEIMTPVLLNVLFSGVDQNDLAYDPLAYAQDLRDIDWEANLSPPLNRASYP